MVFLNWPLTGSSLSLVFFQVEVLRSNCPLWYFQVGVLLTVWAFAVQLGELASRSPRIRRARKIPLFLLRPTDPPHLRSTHRSDFLHKVLLIDVLVFQLGILTVFRFFSSYTRPILTNTQFISYNTFLTDGSLFGNSLRCVSYISRQSMCTSCHVLTIFLAPHQMSQIFSINWLTTTRAPAIFKNVFNLNSLHCQAPTSCYQLVQT